MQTIILSKNTSVPTEHRYEGTEQERNGTRSSSQPVHKHRSGVIDGTDADAASDGKGKLAEPANGVEGTVEFGKTVKDSAPPSAGVGHITRWGTEREPCIEGDKSRSFAQGEWRSELTVHLALWDLIDCLH